MLACRSFLSVFTRGILFTFFATPISRAQQTFYPAAVPLAVRSTYFSAFESTTNSSVYSTTWPTTPLSPNGVLGWSGLARVDGTTYSWLGDPLGFHSTNLTNVQVTATRTIFTLEAGPMEFNITFLSPIEPRDFVRQSMPLSYVSFEARSLDQQSHAVEVYSDISAEWVSGDRTHGVTWTTNPTSGVVHHAITLSTQQPFVDINEQAEWGTLHYAAPATASSSYKSGADTDCRGAFNNTGKLDNSQDTAFRGINQRFPVFAIAQDLGQITVTVQPITWAIGFTRNPAVQLRSVKGSISTRSLYYQSNLTDDTALLSTFLADFPNATQRATALDNKISAAAAGLMPGTAYSDLVSLVPRQVLGATELTVGLGSDGKLNQSDMMMFMRNNGGQQTLRTQPVEVLYAAWPMFMFIDPTLGKPLLEPLLSAQNTPDYTLPYAMPDLGLTYPNVTASNTPHTEGVEHSASMLIMAYAHARISGDGSMLAQHYKLLSGWADYLVNNTLALPSQFSTDNLGMVNQTNLAIKGIIAVQAMSGASAALGVSADAKKYADAARSLYAQWKSLAVGANGQLLASYGQQSTWTLGYNLFADKFLNTSLVDDSVYSGQSAALGALISGSPGITGFGLPVDSSSTGVITSSWNMLTAAVMSDSVRTDMVSRIHTRASFNVSAGAFPLNYDSGQGSTILGIASPAQGAMYAPLALTLQAKPISTAGFTLAAAKSSSHAGAIAGGVIGALAGVAAVAGLGVFLWRRRRRAYRGGLGRADSQTFLDLAAGDKRVPAHRSFNGSHMVRPPSSHGASTAASTTDLAPRADAQYFPAWSAYDAEAARAPSSSASVSEPLPEPMYAGGVRRLPPTPAVHDGRSSPPLPSPPREQLSAKELMRLRIVQEDRAAQSERSPHPLTALTAASPGAAQLLRGLSLSSGASSSAPSRGHRTQRSSVSDMYALRLREEVEELRMEMAAMRGARAAPLAEFEPPPSYS